MRPGQRKKERHKYLSKPQFEALLRAALGAPWACAPALLYAAGCMGLRIGETVALNRDCFRRIGERIAEIRTLKQEGNPVLDVALSKKAQGYFKKYLKMMPEGQYYLFRARRGKGHLSKSSAARIFKWCALRAGLAPEFSFHCLRHYRGTRLWAASKDQVRVQKQLRHKSVMSTAVYMHMDESEAIQLADEIDD